MIRSAPALLCCDSRILPLYFSAPLCDPLQGPVKVPSCPMILNLKNMVMDHSQKEDLFIVLFLDCGKVPEAAPGIRKRVWLMRGKLIWCTRGKRPLPGRRLACKETGRRKTCLHAKRRTRNLWLLLEIGQTGEKAVQNQRKGIACMARNQPTFWSVPAI